MAAKKKSSRAAAERRFASLTEQIGLEIRISRRASAANLRELARGTHDFERLRKREELATESLRRSSDLILAAIRCAAFDFD